jgi:hypothetical protein
MQLLVLAGLVTPPTREQIGDPGMVLLVLAAERMLRAGFHPDANFLSGCCDYELEALAHAGDRLAANRAAYVAAASQGLKQAALATGDSRAVEAVADAEELAINRANADAALRGSVSHPPSRLTSRTVEIGSVTGVPSGSAA